jgi:hypothetical protein
MATAPCEAGSGLIKAPDSAARDGADGHSMPGPSFDLSDHLYRYRRAGNLATSVGVIAGLASYAWGLIPAGAGFLVGVLFASTVTAVIQAKSDARRSARSASYAR